MSRRFDGVYMVEVAAAVVISVAAAMTSWVGFQAALWDGEQAAHYTRPGAARVQATSAATTAGQLETADLPDVPGLAERHRPEGAAAPGFL